MLLFEFDVGKPWLDTSGITQQILLVHRVVVGLRRKMSAVYAYSKPMDTYDQVKVRPGRRCSIHLCVLPV